MSSNANFSLFTFCLDKLSIGESRISKSPTITELGLICDLTSTSTCFMKLDAPVFGVCI